MGKLGRRGSFAFITWMSLVSATILLHGCKVGPEFVRPQADINDTWTEEGDPRVTTQIETYEQWWKAFNDPALERLIESAYRQNLGLQAAGLRILEARAQLGIAIGLQYPQIQELFASATAVGLSNNAPNGDFMDRYFGDYQVGFDAFWELDFWGRYRRGVEAETATLAGAVADYDSALVSLTAEVARTYTVIRTTEVLIQLAQDNIAVQEEGLEIAESRLRNGVTTELDTAQARALLESTKATVPQLIITLRQSQNALSTLLGQPVGIVLSQLYGDTRIPEVPPEIGLSLPAELLRRRPDIRRAEFAAAAQSARIGIAKADLYPSFALVGDVGFESSSHSQSHFQNIFDHDSIFYSIGPDVRWPILNYGRIKNNVRAQDARFQELLVNYRNTVLIAAQEVEDALTGFLRAQDSTAFQQNAVDAARRAVDIALVQYREGAVDYQRVLDTQRVLLQEENTLAEQRSSVATYAIALYKALGGGWEIRLGQPLIPIETQLEMEKRTDWGNLLRPSPQDRVAPPRAMDASIHTQPGL